MERFEGNHTLAGVFGLTGLLLLSGVVFVISQAYPQFPNLTFAEAAAGMFLFGGFSAAALFLFWGAAEASASFVVDDHVITRHAWNRSRTLAWRDVVRIDELSAIGHKANPHTFGRLYLWGADGLRMPIRLHFVCDGPLLRRALEPHLVALREADLRSIAKHGRVFRPTRTLGIVVLAFMVPLFLIGGLGAFDPAANGRLENGPAMWFIFILSVLASPLLAILGIEFISRKLTLSPDGIALQSVFLDRSLYFTRVESIDIKMEASGDGPAVERAKIRSQDGQSITLDSSMPGYRPTLELLRRHAASKASLARLPDPDFA
jgi:hypothetical protein